MADPISVASGLITLVAFGMKASTSLYQTIKGYNSHNRNVRELREELEALTSVLESLDQAIMEADSDFVALKIPLLRCGNACTDFEAIVVKCTEHSTSSRTSFRDWTRLRYMGDDITGFKNTLASYKSTITIALCKANLRTSAVTTGVLNEYQERIEDTMSDLTEHLRTIDERLQTLLAQKPDDSNEPDSEWYNLRSEQESIQQCMVICTDVASHIDSVRPRILSNTSSSDGHLTVAETTRTGVGAQIDTEQLLSRCKDDISGLLSQLNDRLHEVTQRQNTLIPQRTASEDHDTERRRLQEEIDSIRQSLMICDQASQEAQPNRTNVFEDVSLAEDGHQIMVSTFGDLVCARKISAGARSVQWLGQMSDETLQQLSQHRGPATFKRSSKMR